MEEAAPQSPTNGDAGDGTAKKEEEEHKPATFRELLIRVGSIGNFGIQCVNVALATAGGAANFGTMSTAQQVGKGCIYGSSGLGAAHSPVVVYKERQLTKEDTLRAALNGIREEQGRLTEQNDILSAEIDDLQSEVDRMKDVELALRELAGTQGSQLSELMDLIAENKEINEGLRAVLKSKALEEVISLVLDIDNDGSFTIQDKEIDRLIIGMKLMEDITFDELMFRQEVLDCDGNVDEVIALIKAMMQGGSEEEEGRCTRCTINLCQDPQEWFEKQRKTLTG
ncbi:hypothetical protein ACHAXT_012327 [Thalassiosira profunda]